MNNQVKNSVNSEDAPLILVVDKDPDHLWVNTLGLKDEYRVISAENGKDALEAVGRYRPDLVVTDLVLPSLGGVELCRRLKGDLETAHIPVVILTSNASIESQLEGLNAGVDDYVTKPFDNRLFKLRVRNLLQNRKMLHECYIRELAVPKPPVLVASPDQVFLQHTYDVLEEHYRNPDFSAEKLAEALGVSLRTLHRKLKELSHETPSKLIWAVRLKKAAALLKSPDYRISDVAYEVGFTDSNHFSRQFRRCHGKTPSEYRLEP